MGGIDRADQNISLYRVSIRGKKWYFPLIAHLLDVSVQNAWQLHRQDGGKLDQLAFRRRIVLAVLEGNKRVVSGRGRPSTSSKIDSRYDRIDHIVSDIENDPRTGKKKQLHCRLCHKKATTKCMKCEVPLHVTCFLHYHTKINVLFTNSQRAGVPQCPPACPTFYGTDLLRECRLCEDAL
ncbi:piggyBac transposable element-derived protein 3-like [Homalodisca vitripennis]|uniref:piggyBac transposable element-derived protein 3-like n=1 Tax=Homalodisca vitripennis TaxID=197043 RepID=UPI001EEB9EC0|nr:piggyBac transposable element-derived protein 3-like [Homalodisca vitripennis]